MINNDMIVEVDLEMTPEEVAEVQRLREFIASATDEEIAAEIL